MKLDKRALALQKTRIAFFGQPVLAWRCLLSRSIYCRNTYKRRETDHIGRDRTPRLTDPVPRRETGWSAAPIYANRTGLRVSRWRVDDNGMTSAFLPASCISYKLSARPAFPVEKCPVADLLVEGANGGRRIQWTASRRRSSCCWCWETTESATFGIVSHHLSGCKKRNCGHHENAVLTQLSGKFTAESSDEVTCHSTLTTQQRKVEWSIVRKVSLFVHCLTAHRHYLGYYCQAYLKEKQNRWDMLRTI